MAEGAASSVGFDLVGTTRISLAEFNEWPPEQAATALAPVLDCGPWQRVLVAGRPYGSPRELAATSDGVVLALGWPDVAAALGEDTDAVPPSLHGTAEAAEYADRFGVPFVLERTGRTAESIRDALTERLAGTEEDERQLVRRELAAIVRNRLATSFV